MTVMPLIAPTTAPRGASGPAPATEAGVAADFAALVDQALATGVPPTGEAHVTAAPSAEGQPVDLPTPPSTPAPAHLAAPLTTLPTAPSLLAMPGSSSLPPVAGLPPATPDDEPEPATPDAPAPGTAGPVPVVGLPVPPVLPVAVDAPASLPAATSSPTPHLSGADSPAPLPGVGPASPADAPAPSDPARASADSPLPAAPAPVASPAPASPPVAGPDSVAATVAPAAPVLAPAVTTTTAPASPVTAQVFPEVTRLVSTGNGTHRVTLQLNPAALGEVRVTLTVRAGVVRVSLAASSEAQASLLHGAPELRRLLELTGASDTRIVVRDLPATGTPPLMTAPPSTPTDTGTGAFGQPGSGQVGHGGDRSQDQHARTRDGATTARDGDHDEAVRPRPIDPTTRTRTSGVDVTM